MFHQVLHGNTAWEDVKTACLKEKGILRSLKNKDIMGLVMFESLKTNLSFFSSFLDKYCSLLKNDLAIKSKIILNSFMK